MIIDLILAHFLFYFPEIEKKKIKILIESRANIETWKEFCADKIKRGYSSFSILDEIETTRSKLVVEDEYYQNTLLEVLSELAINVRLDNALN